jgi:hypothetical protein
MRQIATRALVILACVVATQCSGSDPASPTPPPSGGSGGSGGGGGAGAGSGGGGGATRTSVTEETEFDDGQWEDVVQSFGAGGDGGGGRLTYLGQQGAYYRQVTINVSSAGGGSAAQVAVFSFKQGAVYFPSTDGEIVSIDYSESSINQSAGNGQYSAPAVRQNGKLYTLVPGGKAFTTPETSWTTHSLTGLTQNDFRTIASAAEHPDFSTNGGRMEVGFMRTQIVQAGASGSTTKVGIDNYRLMMYRR